MLARARGLPRIALPGAVRPVLLLTPDVVTSARVLPVSAPREATLQKIAVRNARVTQNSVRSDLRSTLACVGLRRHCVKIAFGYALSNENELRDECTVFRTGLD